MNAQPWINLLRADSRRVSYQIQRSDYPLRLLTRRRLGMHSAAIMGSRRNAPRHVSPGGSREWRRRPPC